MRRRKTPTSRNNKSYQAEYVITDILNKYALRLLHQAQMSEELQEFYFGLLNYSQRNLLADLLNEDLSEEEAAEIRGTKNNRYNNWPNVELSISDPELLSDSLQKIFTTPKRNQKITDSLFLVRLKKLAELIDLNETEEDLLLFFFIWEQDDNFERLCRNASDKSWFLDFVSIVVGHDLSEVQQAFNQESKLINMNLIDINHRGIQINERVYVYFQGLQTNDILTSMFDIETPGTSYPLKSFGIPKDSLKIIRELLKSDQTTCILLYGYPGSGKTELVKSLQSVLKRKACWINVDSGHRESFNRRMSLMAADNLARTQGAFVVMDEADEFLGAMGRSFSMFRNDADSTSKAWLNTFLDNKKSDIIFITNEIEGMNLSVKRRFDYSLQFNKPDEKIRKNFIKTAVKNHPLSVKLKIKDINKLLKPHNLTPATVSKVLDCGLKLINQCKNSDTDQHLQTMNEVLMSHSKLMQEESGISHSILKPVASFDTDFIHSDSDLALLQDSIQNFIHSKKKLKQGSISHLERGGMCILLHGPSGTGKSEYVRYLAQKLKQKLHYLRASDIMSKWVGDNERNVRQAFKLAQATNKILFLDEIDTFMSNRAQTQSNWEQSLTNEFLTNMENFCGILICTTNMTDALDPAVSRRFHWKIRMNALIREKRIRAVGCYFKAELDLLDEKNLEVIENLEGLTIGDIRAVWNRYRFNKKPKELEKGENNFPVNELLREVEFRSKGQAKIVGF